MNMFLGGTQICIMFVEKGFRVNFRLWLNLGCMLIILKFQKSQCRFAVHWVTLGVGVFRLIFDDR